MELLTKWGCWHLYERPDKRSGEWRSIKLVGDARKRKSNWWLGWNGERLARNSDAMNLKENGPEWMYDNVVEWLRANR